MEKAQGFYVRVNVIQMYLQGGNFTADHTGACVASNARRTNAVLDPETTSCIYLEHKKRLYEMNSAYAWLHILIDVFFKYIAVHQTYMEFLLKDCLAMARVSGVQEAKDDEEVQAQEVKEIKEESICVDMDFAENYEVLHKVELQSANCLIK